MSVPQLYVVRSTCVTAELTAVQYSTLCVAEPTASRLLISLPLRPPSECRDATLKLQSSRWRVARPRPGGTEGRWAGHNKPPDPTAQQTHQTGREGRVQQSLQAGSGEASTLWSARVAPPRSGRRREIGQWIYAANRIAPRVKPESISGLGRIAGVLRECSRMEEAAPPNGMRQCRTRVSVSCCSSACRPAGLPDASRPKGEPYGDKLSSSSRLERYFVASVPTSRFLLFTNYVQLVPSSSWT